MHNQNRSQYKARQSDPIVADALCKKAASWNTLTRQLQLSRRDGGTTKAQGKQNLACNTTTTSSSGSCSTVTTTTTSPLRRCDEETCLKVSYKLLLVNPDPSYLWNARRELITFTQLSTELELTKAALLRNPKAYAAWYHRKWCVNYFSMQAINNSTDSSSSSSSSICSVQLILEQELYLCSELLNADERNFHCWNYRRFVVGALASNLWSSSLSSSLARSTTVKEDKGSTVCDNAAESSQHPPLLHPSIDSFRALDGSWDTFVNALITTSTDSSSDHYHSPYLPYRCLMGPQLTRNDSTPHSDNENNETSPNLSSITREDQRNQLLELLRGEWLFTTHKIEQNFSNYSAYHYRSKLLPLWISVSVCSSASSSSSSGGNAKNNKSAVSTIHQFLRSEFQLVRNAVYTEPDDQSSWWYHRFLLDYCKNLATTESGEDNQTFTYVDVLLVERDAIHELLRAEDDQCKWGWITLHAISLRLIDITLMKRNTDTTSWLENHDTSITNKLQLLQEEAEICLLKLMELDPYRLQRYQDMIQDLKVGCELKLSK